MVQGLVWAVVVVAAALVVEAEDKIWYEATPGMKQLEEFLSSNTQAVSVLVLYSEVMTHYSLDCTHVTKSVHRFLLFLLYVSNH